LPSGTIAIAIGFDDDAPIAGMLAPRIVVTPCVDPLDIGIPLGDDIPGIDDIPAVVDVPAAAGDDVPRTTNTRTTATTIAATLSAPATATARRDRRGFPSDGCAAAASFELLDMTTPSFAN
jgi:hypothetical protein